MKLSPERLQLSCLTGISILYALESQYLPWGEHGRVSLEINKREHNFGTSSRHTSVSSVALRAISPFSGSRSKKKIWKNGGGGEGLDWHREEEKEEQQTKVINIQITHSSTACNSSTTFDDLPSFFEAWSFPSQMRSCAAHSDGASNIDWSTAEWYFAKVIQTISFRRPWKR